MNHEHVWFDRPNFQEQVHDSFPTTIHANRLDARVIECPKIYLCQRDISSGRDIVDEALQRFLVDDDLLHCCTQLEG